jgi:hypothetical protein
VAAQVGRVAGMQPVAHALRLVSHRGRGDAATELLGKLIESEDAALSRRWLGSRASHGAQHSQ